MHHHTAHIVWLTGQMPQLGKRSQTTAGHQHFNARVTVMPKLQPSSTEGHRLHPPARQHWRVLPSLFVIHCLTAEFQTIQSRLQRESQENTHHPTPPFFFQYTHAAYVFTNNTDSARLPLSAHQTRKSTQLGDRDELQWGLQRAPHCCLLTQCWASHRCYPYMTPRQILLM